MTKIEELEAELKHKDAIIHKLKLKIAVIEGSVCTNCGRKVGTSPKGSCPIFCR